MQRYEYIQCRVEPQLRQRLARLRDERHINVSAWLRRVISEALDREFPAPQPSDPLPGWEPKRLSDNSWGAVFNGNTEKLPLELIGRRIIVTQGNKTSWMATVEEVLERSTNRVRVRHSGKPA